MSASGRASGAREVDTKEVGDSADTPDHSKAPKRARLTSTKRSPSSSHVDGASPEDLDGAGDPLDYPRKRASIACRICRLRKSRCDGGRPKCKLCTDLGAVCEYREPSLKIDQGDRLILDKLAQIESLLKSRILATPIETPSPHATASVGSPPGATTSHGPTQFHPAHGPMSPVARMSSAATVDGPSATNISTMPKRHSTPALHLLQWPVIRDLASGPCDPQVLMQLEMQRRPLDLSLATSIHSLRRDLPTYSRSFFESVNNWYAVVNPNNWHKCVRAADAAELRDGPESCMVLMVGALGAAAYAGSISHVPRQQRPPGMDYFAAGYWILPRLALRNDVLSAQCHILAAAYLLYIVRPLEAWNLLCQASVKLQLLLSHPNTIRPEVKELSERVYWNTLLIESDLLAELDLPHSGIVQFEESMDLPKSFPYDAAATTQDELQGVDDLWYFSAEIALRRLLNRVSHLMYTGSHLHPDMPEQLILSIGATADELDRQLNSWYDSLPAAIKFSRDRLPARRDQIQTVLRLRYFACRTIIFRPYVQAVLADENLARRQGVVDACGRCLDACIRQIEDVTAHHAGHLPYLWQGVLSITSQTLLLMGVTLSRPLRELLPPRVRMDDMILGVVTEVERLAHLAPSLQRCAEILREAEERRRMLVRRLMV